MEIYKQKNVKTMGPKEERVILGNQLIASAQYFYNIKKQLIRAQYYLDDNPDGKTLYLYNKTGLFEEASFNKKNQLVEKIRYQTSPTGIISTYKILNKNISWNFIYKNDVLRLGKRYFKNQLTEYFVITKRTKNYYLKNLFTEDNQRIGSVEYFYKNDLLIKRIRRDNVGFRKAEHHYTLNGLLKEICLFKMNAKNIYELEKKKVLLYSK